MKTVLTFKGRMDRPQSRAWSTALVLAAFGWLHASAFALSLDRAKRSAIEVRFESVSERLGSPAPSGARRLQGWPAARGRAW